MAAYIGKVPVPEKARLVAEDYVSTDPSEKLLKGNISTFPGAYIEYRLTV